LLGGFVPRQATAQTVVSINVAADRHPISPLIYGAAFPSKAQALDLNLPISRWGGNEASSYNWDLNCAAKGNDWYFESWPNDSSAVPGEAIDTFISTVEGGGALPIVTMPMLPWVGNVPTSRDSLWSYSIAKYGPQTGADPYNSDAGNGISSATNQPITTNDKNDANTPNSLTMQQEWLNHLISKWGKASGDGIKYFLMDNEPSIWYSTHQDVHPIGESYDELYNDYLTYAGAIRATDPDALIGGPEEWGWTGYFYSGLDMQYGSTHGWSGSFPDRSAHGNMANIPWLLQSLCNYQKNTGKQLLNILTVHYYPQQGEYSNNDSSAMQTIRNRSTRSLWDPDYVDTSWISSVVELIPLLQSWVTSYYPGLQTGITEYNWGDEGEMNGATTQADIYGIFGRQGLNLGSRWTVPATDSPTYLAMKMYRNYDGAKHTFGDTSVSCSAPSPDDLSAFAAERTSDKAMTIMLINKLTTVADVKVDFSGFSAVGYALPYQISSAHSTSIEALASLPISSSAFVVNLPPQSVTLYVVPNGSTAPEYNFESGTQGWWYENPATAKVISSVAQSSTEAFSGKNSLAVNFDGPAGTAQAYAIYPTVPAGDIVAFHVWVPAGSSLAWVEPLVEQGTGTSAVITSTKVPIASLHTNAWNTITVKVPSNAQVPLTRIAVNFNTTATWKGTCYIDAVTW